MNEDLIPFELAKKLKEKGYPQQCGDDAYILEDEYEEFEVGSLEFIPLIPEHLQTVVAPTISQVLKWLREEKKIHIFSEIASMGWYYTIYPKIRIKDGKLKTGNTIIDRDASNTYDEAILAGIEYALDNLI